MDFPNLSEESIDVSKTLAAHNIILPVVKLRREEAMYEFNVLSVFHCHNTDPVVMPCGSRAEGLAMLTGRHQAYLSSSDEDFIIFANYFKVCDTRSEFLAMIFSKPISYHVLRIPDAAYPGYSKLEVSQHAQIISEWTKFQGSKFFLKNSFKETIINSFIGKFPNTVHGPAVKIDLRSNTTTTSDDIERNGPKKFEFKNRDYVLCLRGKSWPNEALEWKKRKRSSEWLSKELFDNIIKSGYLLAGVGHKESEENEIQWRVSFNRAEQLIIESFNETQIQCIMLLRLLKGSRLSKLAGKNITSYTMKTVMFWSLDEIKKEVWQPSNLLYCFCVCLKKLKLFVKEEFIPDYFIRKRNHMISSEFNLNEKRHTIQFLNSFLDDPKKHINILLNSFNMNFMHPNCRNLAGQHSFISFWLCLRITMAEHYHGLIENSFSNLYDGYNIENILLRCNDVFDKLTILNYAQPFINLLQNCICVLQYMRLRRKQEIAGHITDSGIRRQCLEYMKSSHPEHLTHTALRVATCYLDEGANVQYDCINLIRSVTNHPDSHLFMKTTYSDVVKSKLENLKVHAFDKLQPTCLPSEFPIYNKIISEDLKCPDPYTTVKQFKRFEKQGNQVGWLSSFLLVWDYCWVNVTFMPAELPILPKPAALELCIDNTQKKISFHPFLYGLLLEFLWHAKYSQTKEEAEIVLDKMTKNNKLIPHQQQSIGLNFITYCCSIMKDYPSASQYVIRSFKLNPVKQNVAYLYIKYIVNVMRELSSNDLK